MENDNNWHIDLLQKRSPLSKTQLELNEKLFCYIDVQN